MTIHYQVITLKNCGPCLHGYPGTGGPPQQRGAEVLPEPQGGVKTIPRGITYGRFYEKIRG
jgi:hypothetical protein